MDSGLISIALGVLIGLIVTGIYGLMATAVRKRVTIRSPESQAIEQMVPAVNALMEMQGPQTQALIAILEAQKGICNGNVDAALKTTRDAKIRYDDFLLGRARVEI
jgi:hypothetical protein